MKKQTLVLLLIGELFMSFTVFTSSWFTVPESITDFFKGFGLVLVFTAFIMMVNKRSTCNNRSTKA
jgi:uncharacterized membrane protein YdcZ (DUF606 family)